jgi:hypothetical protein
MLIVEQQKAEGIRLRSHSGPSELRRDGAPKQQGRKGGQKAERNIGRETITG